MSTYKNLIGKDVNSLTADPDNDAAEGQIWYNSTVGQFKNLIIGEAWSSGAAMVRQSASAQLNLGTGIQTAALVAGGYSPYSNLTEEYNGSGWSSGGNLSTARITSGFGTQTAGVAVGGLTPPNTTTGVSEEYDGSSWTAGGSLNTARSYSGGSGTLTAGVSFGGLTPPFTTSNATEEYNGTAFTSVNNMNVYGRHMGSSGRGPQTATLAFGGGGGPTAPIPADTNMATTESYDGTNWTAVNSMNTARRALGSAGIQTSALAFGGSTPPNTNATESWDGTNWTTSPATLANARNTPQSIGTSSSALYAGGATPLFSSGLVEEYNRSTNVITGAAFASGGNANVARRQIGYSGAGPQDAFMIFGGFAPPGMQNVSEEYNGATWTATPTLNTTRGQLGGFGITTAAVACGGDGNKTNVEEYNGSSWTSVNSMSQSRYEFGCTGILTAGLALEGDQGPGTPFGSTCEEYDGTNWSSGGTANTARRANSGAGTQTATITAGGVTTGPADTANVESYDGSSWSEQNNLNKARSAIAHIGGPAGQTSALVTGGNGIDPGITEQWNGTNMVSGVNLSSLRSFHGAGGTTTSGIVAVGQNNPGSTPYGSNVTEEYEGETVVANYKTISSS